ncbi:MAG TPA: family 16 glycoside hydrolase [Urbifossiella sp.]|nr:family 16 glycoside hydrolase [Urbifossiella sp.]
MRPVLLAAAAVLAAVLPAPAVQPDGTRDLFNGKDLTGFRNVNCAPGTFFVKDGEIVTTGNPTGFLSTDKHYENFELDFDWMHVEKEKMANSGLFVWGDPLPAVGTPYTRGIEVQVLINFAPKDGWATSHGDIFSIHGARCTPDRVHPTNPKMERCLPSENRVKGGGQWNHYKVLANDGAIKLHVNGKEVSGVSKSNPRKGYLAFESEGAECHFKNVKIKELPSTNPKPEEVAKVWEGHVSLFTGLDLTGWKTEAGAWKAGGGVLRAAGKAPLVSEKAYEACDLVFDVKVPAKAQPETLKVSVGGLTAEFPTVRKGQNPGSWRREVLQFRKTTNPQSGAITFEPAEGLELMNVFVKELK